MRWTVSDGTVVELGGEVFGTSPFADRLRRDVRDARFGSPRAIQAAPPPALERFDPDDEWHVHVWVHEMALRASLHMKSAPEVLLPDDWHGSHVTGAVH